MLHVHEVVMYVQFQFHKGTIRTMERAGKSSFENISIP